MIITERTCKCAMCGEETTEFIKYGIYIEEENALSFNAGGDGFCGFIVNKCVHCGYVSISLSDKALINPKYLNTIEYKTCSAAADCEVAKRFLSLAYITKEEGNSDKAIGYMFCAMWTANSEGSKNAIAEKIINMFFQLEGKVRFSDLTKLRVIDLLRRMARFAEAGLLCIKLYTDDAVAKNVCALEYALVESKNTGVYYISDAKNIKRNNKLAVARLKYMLNFGKMRAEALTNAHQCSDMAYAI